MLPLVVAGMGYLFWEVYTWQARKERRKMKRESRSDIRSILSGGLFADTDSQREDNER